MADDIKVIDSKDDMINLFDTHSDDVTFNRSISVQDKIDIMERENITPITLYDKDDNPTDTLYAKTMYETGATGGSKIGVKLSSITSNEEDFVVSDSDYGVMFFDKMDLLDTYLESVLNTIGLVLDKNNSEYARFKELYTQQLLNEVRYNKDKKYPLYYNTKLNDILYYIGAVDYVEAVKMCRREGFLPYITDDILDDIFDTDSNTLKVTVADIPLDHMIDKVIRGWRETTDLWKYHSLPSTEAMVHAYNTMYNDIMEDWGTSRAPVGADDIGKKPNVFIISITGKESYQSAVLNLRAFRLGEGIGSTISVFQSTTSPTYNKYMVRRQDIVDQRINACQYSVLGSWTFDDRYGWSVGGYSSHTSIYKYRISDTFLNAGPRILDINSTGDAGYNTPNNFAGNYEYGNINCKLSHSPIYTFDNVINLTLPDLKLPRENEPSDDYVRRINDCDDNPILDLDTGLPTPYTVVPIVLPPVIPTLIPKVGTDTTIDIVKKENPTPTPPPPSAEKDEGDTPLPPSIISDADNGIFSVYNPTSAEVTDFGHELWSNNVREILKTIWQNPMEGIMSFQLVYCTPQTGANKLIGCGAWKSNVSSKTVVNQFTEIDCGSINLFEHYGDARDYAPYTDIALFLPFIGFVDMDIYEVMGSVIRVKYVVDVLTGTTLASVISTRDGSEKVLYTFSGNCSVQIPLTSADKSAIVTGYVSGALSGAKTGAFLGGLAGGDILTGGLIGSVLGGAWGGFTGGVSINRSGEMGANVGALGIKKPYLLVKRYKAFSASGYGGLLGYADNYRCRVGDVSGYCVFTNPIVNVNATDEELAEILSLLTTGVIV